MFELQKGDPDNLEGRVLIYMRQTDCDDHPEYQGLYMSADPVDYFRFVGMEVPEEIQRATKNFISKIIEDEEVPSIPFGGRPVDVPPLEKILGVHGDVIYAGEIQNGHPKTVLQVLTALAKAYLVVYGAQMMKRICQKGLQVKSKRTDTFEDYDCQGLKMRLYNMIGSLFAAIQREDEKEKGMVIADLRQVTEGSPFFRDIINIIGLSQTGIPNKEEIISLYVEKAGAVHEQDYEKAAVIQKELEALLKSKD